jgi:esterase/lipase superfamily enzyme
MYFITNRLFKENIKSPKDRKVREVEFDLENNIVSNTVYFCKKDNNSVLSEIGNERFFEQLADENITDILLYIHGYNNEPKDVFKNSNKLQTMYDETLKDSKKSVLVIPIIWACGGNILDYSSDQANADGSALAMSRAFEKFLNHSQNNPCSKRINILAHSMGSRVLRQTLIVLKDNIFSNGIPQIFRNIFMVASDVVNETLHKDQIGSLIPDSCRNCVVYYANDDLALNSSKIINLKNKIVSKRLGHTGVEDMQKVSRNVYNIDCDDFNNSYDHLIIDGMGKGHTYFLEDSDGKHGKLFLHTVTAITTGRVTANEDRELIL